MLTSDTKRKIDAARDILVGKIPMPTAQVEQITLALIYKFMGDMDRRARALGDTSGFFANGYEDYAWERLMDKALSARDRVKRYGEGLEKMSANPHIPQLFRDIFRRAFLPFNDPETLKLFLDQIDQFSYDHSEQLGNAFEYLLSVLGSQGDAGQFRTPRHIIEFIVEAVEPQAGDRILDPACGTAGFLIAAFKYLQRQGLAASELKKVTEQVVGFDISHDMVRLSLVNLYLHHFPNPHIYEYDSLTSEDRWCEQYDCVLANPPFMSPKGGIRPHSRFAIPSNRAEVLFVDYIMEHLSINGKAGIIVPEGVIFQSQKAHTALRKMMVEDNFLWAVVSLPSGVFQPYAGVKTSILLFDREIARKSDEIVFVNIKSDGYDLGAQRRVVTANDLPNALEILKQYKRTGELGEMAAGAGSDELAHAVKKAQIAESGTYQLSGERYRQREVRASGAWPMVELGEVCEVLNGFAFKSEKYIEDGLRVIRITNVQKGQIIDDAPKFYPIECQNELMKYVLYENDLLLSLTGNVGRAGLLGKDLLPAVLNQRVACLRILEKTSLSIKYLFYSLNTELFEQACIAASSGVAQKNLSTEWLKSYKIPLPPLAIQQELVAELDRYQRIIDGARQVVESWTPSFEVDEAWEKVELGEVLEYEQPTRYIVKSVDYSDSYDIPVLTAGKTFILGKTNEMDGVFNEGLPVIIFDDFTTATKFVDFPFKVKSSAMKILRAKQNIIDIRFAYFIMQHIDFKINEHKRFWISEYSKIKIPLPPLAVQHQIVEAIEQEQQLVNANKQLIEQYTAKIDVKIQALWQPLKDA